MLGEVLVAWVVDEKVEEVGCACAVTMVVLADVDGRNDWLGIGGSTRGVLFCRYFYLERSAGRLGWHSCCGCSRKLFKHRRLAGE